jgi:hypothetical protein
VQRDESMVSIMYLYNTQAEVLAQLNPEIPFSQCDFSLETGGPACTVFLSIGQQIRVPVPSPTPTLTPTLSGSETATPLPTATFNAPSILSPGDRVLFTRDQFITLRWIGSGTLGPSETYRIDVRNLTTDQRYSADTINLSFIVPVEWQNAGPERHDYEWSVSVVRLGQAAGDRDTVLYQTPARIFSWEGRGEQP